MNADNENCNQINNIRDTIINIWYRARINAYAHKVAEQRYENENERLFKREIASALISITFISITFVFAASDIPLPPVWRSIVVGLTTIVSIFFSIVSIYYSAIGNYEKNDVIAHEHKVLVGSFQYIAQKAREVKWPDKPHDELLFLLRKLEEDFQLLKARGTEPCDMDFDKAHEIFRKVRNNPNTKIAQSFDMNNYMKNKSEEDCSDN